MREQERIRELEAQLAHAEGIIQALRHHEVDAIVGKNDVALVRTRQAEEKDAILAAIVESAEDAIISKDLDGTVTSWNVGAHHIYGYRPDEMIGQPVTRIIPAELQSEEATILKRVRRGEFIARYETVRLAKDGRRIPVSLTFSPIRNTAGAIVGASKIGRDISERKRAEEALSESEGRFRTMLDAMAPLAWIANPDGYITWYNQRWYEYTGTTPQQMKGWGWQKVHDPQMLPRVLKRWKTSIATGQPFEMEFPLRGADGRFREFLTRGYPLKDAKGRVVQWCGTNSDISERKQMEQNLANTNEELQNANEQLAVISEELRVNNEQLEQRVIERTSQLRALAGELTQSEERERRRIAQILHDELQQLLVAAHVYLEVMLKHKDAGSLQKELQRAKRIVEESGDLARKLSHELSPVVLHAEGLTAALKWLARWMGTNHGLDVRTEVDPIAEPVEADVKILLFQSVRELLFNVVKHAGVKRARVRMSLSPENHCEILVSDNGKGFDTTKARPGHETSGGFGLFSIRERLQLLGGRMEVDGGPGRGSRFRLIAPVQESSRRKAGSDRGRSRLKRAELALVAKRSPGRKRNGAAAAARAGRSRIRILLVDDHQVMRDGLAALVAQQPDMEVVAVASDGQEAIEQARRLQPDVMLMDVSMRRMDGIQATRRITEAWPRIKVIGLTMYEDDLRHGLMFKAGAVNCLLKSGPAKVLIRAIHAAVPPASATRPGRSRVKGTVRKA